MTSRRARPILLLAPALLLAGCSYGYSNPAERLGTGEVSGRVLTSSGGALTALPGVTVQLHQSYNQALTRDTGRYFLAGLMPGRHRLLFSLAPDLALQRDVEMSWGADGQPEGVVLGDLVMRRAVTLQGRVALPTWLGTGGNFIQVEQVTAVDDVTGQVVSLSLPPAPPPPGVPAPMPPTWSVDYAFTGAPTGRHRVSFALSGQTYACSTLAGGAADPATCTWAGAASYLGGPIELDIPESSEGLKLDLVDVTPSFPGPLASGKLRFRAAVSGASWGGGFDVAVLAQPGGAPVTVPAPDSTGGYELDLPPGDYQIQVAMPAGYTGPLVPPPAGRAIVTDGRTTELGSFYAVDASVYSRAANACFVAADCSSGNCVDGSCAASTCLAASGVECDTAYLACVSVPTLRPCAGGRGYCAGRFAGDAVCVPTGQSSCLDGGSLVLPVCRPN